jgi:hypothetical protein
MLSSVQGYPFEEFIFLAEASMNTVNSMPLNLSYMRFLYRILFLILFSCGNPKMSETELEREMHRIDSLDHSSKNSNSKKIINPQFEINDSFFVRDLSVTELKNETMRLMKNLHIASRKYFDRDNELTFNRNPKYETVNAFFHSDQKATSPEDFNNRNRVNLIYLTPTVEVSPIVFESVFNKKDSTKLFKLKSQAIIIHELVHYYTGNPYSKPEDKSSEINYYSSPLEIEANFACGTFFLTKYNKPALDSLMKLNVSPECLKKRVIMSYLDIAFPDTKSLTLWSCR